MNIKQKLITLIFMTLVGLVAGSTLVPATASAAAEATQTCGGAKTAILSCKQGKDPKTAQDSGIWGLMLIVLNIMTAGVGVLAVGGVTYAAILYASSSDNADQTKQAKQIIKNTAIGIIAYGGMYLALNFIIPGGIFS